MYWKYIKISAIFLAMILFVITGLSGCFHNNQNPDPPAIYQDEDFVRSKFPNLKAIESVQYSYEDTGDGGIGLQPKEFIGVIQIAPDFTKEIYEKYKWEEQKVDLTPFMGGDSGYPVLYSDDFDDYIHTASFVGTFYLDKDRHCLYFWGEY